ncbi:hypothetical protein HHI36_008179, partial [Cryptolaemus montrouzieri]
SSNSPMSSTCWDNIFTNSISASYQASTINFHIADHRAQSMKIGKLIKPTDNITYKYVRKFNDPTYHLFKEKIRMTDWPQITQYEDAEQCYDEFYEKPRPIWNNAEIKNIKDKLEAAEIIMR